MYPDPDFVAENDQTAARARDDLERHVGSMRNLLADADGDEQTALVVAAATLIREEETFPRDRLASLLAVAMVRLAQAPTAEVCRPHLTG
jgi:hypothetical protein